MDTTAITVLTASAIPSVLGMVEAAKRAGLPSRFSPLASVGLGVAFCVFLQSQTLADWRSGILLGIADGLSASGLYAGTKALFTSSDASPAAPAAS